MATTYTTILGSDSLSDGRVKINANYLTIESDIEAVQTIADGKMSYSGTVPAIGDMLVAADITWATAKKKVFSASQALVSDSNGQPTSEAKWTAFNKNFGTWATDVAAGDLVVRNTGNENVAGIKTFSSSPIVPTVSSNDNSTKAASTAYVDAQVGATKISIDTTGVVISSSAAETTIFTATIPANTLWTNNWVVGRIFFSSRTVSTTAKVLKLKYGSTTIATVTVTPNATTDITTTGQIDFQLLWAGTTSSQEWSIYIHGVTAGYNLVDTSGLIAIGGAAQWTAAEVSTGALALTVTWQQNSAATEVFTAYHGFLNKI